MVRGMRQIPGEAPRGAGMTLATGLHHALAAQMRPRIRNRQYIMGAMAVVAFGGLAVSQLRDLAVIRVKVGFGDVRMTPSALAHDFQLEAVLVGAANGVRGMAIVTDRQRLAGFGDQRRVDTAVKLLLNALMTASAGLRQIDGIDAGCAIRLGPYVVRGMAACAGGGNCQAALQQAFAVNAFGITLDDLMLRAAVAQRRRLAFTMTARAQVRHS